MVGSEPTGQSCNLSKSARVSFPCRNASGHLSATDPHFWPRGARYFSRSLTTDSGSVRTWTPVSVPREISTCADNARKGHTDNHHDKADKREDSMRWLLSIKRMYLLFCWHVLCHGRRVPRDAQRGSGRWGEISGRRSRPYAVWLQLVLAGEPAATPEVNRGAGADLKRRLRMPPPLPMACNGITPPSGKLFHYHLALASCLAHQCTLV